MLTYTQFRQLYKQATAVLTPEAEQAAVQGQMDPAAGGMPPQDPAAMGAMPPQGAPAGQAAQGQLPPEILQDQQFIALLQQNGIMLDPASGTFVDQTGQPVPPDMIAQAYQEYLQQVQGAMPPPQDMAAQQPPMTQYPAMAATPMDPAMAAAPADPMVAEPAAQAVPADPAAAQQPAAQDAGAIPPEILQDQGYMDFLGQLAGLRLDPNTGTVVDQNGQPVPPEMVVQGYQEYQQQMQADAAQQGAPVPEQAAGQQQQDILSAVESVLENYTAQLDKKIETLMDKIESMKLAMESMRDTTDKRDEEDRRALKEAQDAIAADLNPVRKTASAQKEPRRQEKPRAQANVFGLIMGSRKG